MSQLVSWEYYSSLHDKVSREEFAKAEARAEKEVKLVVGQLRWNLLDDTAFYYEQFQDCICNTIDKMTTDEKSGKGKGIASVSNDGYSENYVVQTEEQLRSELQASIRAWLSGTGLGGAY